MAGSDVQERSHPAVTEHDSRRLRQLADTLEDLIATCNAGIERLRASRERATTVDSARAGPLG
jgi:hypothetical protein